MEFSDGEVEFGISLGTGISCVFETEGVFSFYPWEYMTPKQLNEVEQIRHDFLECARRSAALLKSFQSGE